MTGVTIYQNPADYPGRFVARAWRTVGRRVFHYARPLAVVATLDEARAAVEMRHPGLFNGGREECDDPVILETWL